MFVLVDRNKINIHEIIYNSQCVFHSTFLLKFRYLGIKTESKVWETLLLLVLIRVTGC
jgi:hypothetical protein